MSVTQPANDTPFATSESLSFRGLHRSITMVSDLNEKVLTALRELAARPHPNSLVLLDKLSPKLRGLSAPACRRIAQSPILLCDFEFSNYGLWSLWSAGKGAPPSFAPPSGTLPLPAAISLARSVLTAAWIACSQDRRHAALLFGMSDAVSALIAELRIGDVERIAVAEAQKLRPRWERLTNFWLLLLEAAEERSEQSVQEAHLYGLQLLAGEQLSRRSTHHSRSAARFTKTRSVGSDGRVAATDPETSAPSQMRPCAPSTRTEL
jgi:hypothetical protein